MLKNALSFLVGKKITEQRKKLNLTQKQLAKRLGITLNAVVRMEKGNIAPKMGRLSELAEALECSVVFFFTDQESIENEKILAISNMFMTLTEKEQEAIVHIVASVVSTIRGKK